MRAGKRKWGKGSVSWGNEEKRCRGGIILGWEGNRRLKCREGK